MESLLTNEHREILQISYAPSERDPLLVDTIANRVYKHMIDAWLSLQSLVAAMEDRYVSACKGDDSCAFAEGTFRGLTSRYTLESSANHRDLHFHPDGAAARVFVEGIAKAGDKGLVDRCVFMWDTDYQWAYQGRFPVMKQFLLCCDPNYKFDSLSSEEQAAERLRVDTQRKLVAVMQATNRISARSFEDGLGLFYHVDGKILMHDKQGSLFERPPFWRWREYQ